MSAECGLVRSGEVYHNNDDILTDWTQILVIFTYFTSSHHIFDGDIIEMNNWTKMQSQVLLQ